jgi:hypothetical protein
MFADPSEVLSAFSAIAVPITLAIWRSVQQGNVERRESFRKMEETLTAITGRQIRVETATADHETSDERRFSELAKHIDRIEARINMRMPMP